MTIERTFLEDIIANKEDDTPRLIFADWLDDHGQEERAEFIRNGVRLWADEPIDMGLWNELCNRNDKLLTKETFCEWFGSRLYQRFVNVCSGSKVEIFDNEADITVQFTLRRGFVQEIELPLRLWLSDGKEIVRANPIQQVSLSGRKPGLRGDGRWWWFKEFTSAEQEERPEFICDLWYYLPANTISVDRRGVNSPGYETPEEATEDLGKAAILWAEELQ